MSSYSNIITICVVYNYSGSIFTLLNPWLMKAVVICLYVCGHVLQHLTNRPSSQGWASRWPMFCICVYVVCVCVCGGGGGGGGGGRGRYVTEFGSFLFLFSTRYLLVCYTCIFMYMYHRCTGMKMHFSVYKSNISIQMLKDVVVVPPKSWKQIYAWLLASNNKCVTP